MAEEVVLTDGDDNKSYLEELVEKIVYAKAGDDEVVGTRFDDELFGGEGDDDLRGGPGDDIVQGGPGADVMRGNGVNENDSGRDFLFYGDSPGAVYVSLARGIGRNADAEGDRFIDFENVYGSQFNDTIEGDENNNFLHGSGGDDLLIGAAGSDLLIGGYGDDEMFGGAVDDTLKGGPGSDRFRGGDGQDRFQFEAWDLVSGDRDVILDLEEGDTIALHEFENFTLHYQETDNGSVEITFSVDAHGIALDTGYVIEVRNATIDEVQESILFF